MQVPGVKSSETYQSNLGGFFLLRCSLNNSNSVINTTPFDRWLTVGGSKAVGSSASSTFSSEENCVQQPEDTLLLRGRLGDVLFFKHNFFLYSSSHFQLNHLPVGAERHQKVLVCEQRQQKWWDLPACGSPAGVPMKKMKGFDPNITSLDPSIHTVCRIPPNEKPIQINSESF